MANFELTKIPKLLDFKALPDLDSNFHQKSPILAFLTDFWWFLIWNIWQCCRNGQIPNIIRFHSVARFGCGFSQKLPILAFLTDFWQISNWPKLPDFKVSPDLNSNFHQKLPILAFLTDFWQKMHLNYLVMLFQQSIKYTEKELSLVWCKRKETKFW